MPMVCLLRRRFRRWQWTAYDCPRSSDTNKNIISTGDTNRNLVETLEKLINL
ncbi:hypothetical protein DPMN_047396 [Dreissena polymorpha]|uniref:Uncharacterized protein n=1 Tax=Dreissena polymorpha TaxID=45954 RepID=A0A9D4D7N0_DREPO|nr:hypothetical protein DPMN_047396 [Dreissena polymorpha]